VPGKGEGARSLPENAALLGALIALGVALGAMVVIIFNPARTFVHPTNFEDILGRTVSNGLSLRLSDFAHAIDQWGPSESRPRFLAALIEEYDLKLRLLLDQYLTLPLTWRPISWLLLVFVGPIFLFRLLRNLKCDLAAATAGVAVYVSSTGFLSGLTMAFIPGKGLTTVALIMAMYFLSEIAKSCRGVRFSEAPTRVIIGATLTVFLGLFLDEVGLFAFVVLPILFWPLFFDPHKLGLSKLDWKGIGICALPGLAFLLIVVVIVPSFYPLLFHRPFDYLGNVFAVGIGAQGAQSMFVGPHGSFGWPILWQDFTNLFGVSLVPLQVSPFTTQDPQDAVLIQTTNLPQLLGLGLFFGALAAGALLRNPLAAWLRRALLATGAFIVLMTLLSIRHNPVIIGYYYGASVSLFTALLVGLGIAAVGHGRPLWYLWGVAAAGAITYVQLDNFILINDRWRTLHYEYVVRPMVVHEFTLSNNDVSWAEMSDIRRAWKHGGLETYLKDHAVSVGAVPLIAELRAIDRFRSPRVR